MVKFKKRVVYIFDENKINALYDKKQNNVQ